MKATLITVAYNAGATIEETIRSVQMQTHPDLEYIVVDGGSTDGSREIYQKHASFISRLIMEKDEGLYDAMNKGIQASTGKFIGFLNADDLYAHSTVVEQVIRAGKEKQADIVYGDLVYIPRQEGRQVLRYWKPGPFRKHALRYGWTIPHPTFFCRADLYRQFGMYNTEFKIAADFELLLRFLSRDGLRICYLDDILVRMRIGGKANTPSGILQGNREILRAFKINHLRPLPGFFLIKFLLKSSQLFRRPAQDLKNNDPFPA